MDLLCEEEEGPTNIFDIFPNFESQLWPFLSKQGWKCDVRRGCREKRAYLPPNVTQAEETCGLQWFDNKNNVYAFVATNPNRWFDDERHSDGQFFRMMKFYAQPHVTESEFLNDAKVDKDMFKAAKEHYDSLYWNWSSDKHGYTNGILVIYEAAALIEYAKENASHIFSSRVQTKRINVMETKKRKPTKNVTPPTVFSRTLPLPPPPPPPPSPSPSPTLPQSPVLLRSPVSRAPSPQYSGLPPPSPPPSPPPPLLFKDVFVFATNEVTENVTELIRVHGGIVAKNLWNYTADVRVFVVGTGMDGMVFASCNQLPVFHPSWVQACINVGHLIETGFELPIGPLLGNGVCRYQFKENQRNNGIFANLEFKNCDKGVNLELYRIVTSLGGGMPSCGIKPAAYYVCTSAPPFPQQHSTTKFVTQEWMFQCALHGRVLPIEYHSYFSPTPTILSFVREEDATYIFSELLPNLQVVSLRMDPNFCGKVESFALVRLSNLVVSIGDVLIFGPDEELECTYGEVLGGTFSHSEFFINVLKLKKSNVGDATLWRTGEVLSMREPLTICQVIAVRVERDQVEDVLRVRNRVTDRSLPWKERVYLMPE